MRGDSAFYYSQLMKHLEENEIEFFIRAKNFKKLTEAVYAFVQKTSMNHFHDYSPNNPLYGKIRYTPSAGTLSHKLFLENEFEFLLKAYAYNLYQIFRMEILEDRDYKMMMSTYRNRYQKVAVKIITHGRKKQLNYSSAYPHQKRFIYYLRKKLGYDYGQIGYRCG